MMFFFQIPTFAVPVPSFAPTQALPLTQDQALIGIAAAVKGVVEVKRPGEAIGQVVASGQKIYLGDFVTTDAVGHLQILLLDQTVFTLGANTALKIDKFVYDPASHDGQMQATIAKGVFRYITGKIGHKKPENCQINIPSGTIGIRGTIITGNVGATSLIILNGPGGNTDTGHRVGSFLLSSDIGGETESTHVTRPEFGATLTEGEGPSGAFRVPAEQLQQISDALTPSNDSPSNQDGEQGENGEGASGDQRGENRNGGPDGPGDDGPDGPGGPRGPNGMHMQMNDDGSGEMMDANGNVVGRMNADGSRVMMDADGNVVGQMSADGKMMDGAGNPVTMTPNGPMVMDPNGTMQPMAMPDPGAMAAMMGAFDPSAGPMNMMGMNNMPGGANMSQMMGDFGSFDIFGDRGAFGAAYGDFGDQTQFGSFEGGDFGQFGDFQSFGDFGSFDAFGDSFGDQSINDFLNTFATDLIRDFGFIPNTTTASELAAKFSDLRNFTPTGGTKHTFTQPSTLLSDGFSSFTAFFGINFSADVFGGSTGGSANEVVITIGGSTIPNPGSAITISIGSLDFSNSLIPPGDQKVSATNIDTRTFTNANGTQTLTSTVILNIENLSGGTANNANIAVRVAHTGGATIAGSSNTPAVVS